MIYTFSAGLSSRMSRDSAHDVQVNYLLLIKGQYVLSESRQPLDQRNVLTFWTSWISRSVVIAFHYISCGTQPKHVEKGLS
jgi:hypothetical protein